MQDLSYNENNFHELLVHKSHKSWTKYVNYVKQSGVSHNNFRINDIWHGFLPVSLPQRIEIRKKSEKSSILLLYFLSYCVIRFAANKIKKFLISKKFNISWKKNPFLFHFFGQQIHESCETSLMFRTHFPIN